MTATMESLQHYRFSYLTGDKKAAVCERSESAAFGMKINKDISAFFGERNIAGRYERTLQRA